MIIFTHIPKTAGTLVKNIMQRNCQTLNPQRMMERYTGDSLLSEYLYGKKSVSDFPEGLTGHFPHGIHKIFDASDEDKVSYFTFLRNPVDRWLSAFYAIQNTSYIKNPWSEYVTLFDDVNQDIHEFAQHCIQENRSCNAMVRQLSGIEDIREIEGRTIKRRLADLNSPAKPLLMSKEALQRVYRSLRYTKSLKPLFPKSESTRTSNSTGTKKSTYQKIIRNIKMQLRGTEYISLEVYNPLWDQTKSYTESEYRRMLEKAKENLKAYKFVGLGENVSQEVKQLCKTFNWQCESKIPRVRKTKYHRIPKSRLPKKTMALIDELNKYDIELFNWAKSQFPL